MNALVWKIFIRRKIKEIFLLLLAIFVPYIFGKLTTIIFPIDCVEKPYALMCQEGFTLTFGLWIFGVLICLIMFLIGYVLYCWYEINWKEAKKEAKRRK